MMSNMLTFYVCIGVAWCFATPIELFSNDCWWSKNNVNRFNLKQKLAILLLGGPILWLLVLVEVLIRCIATIVEKTTNLIDDLGDR